ncbi:CPCC family cysteine-rich protein [Pseudomonas sp. H1h]|uniref:CPCC family cysteine-rich protein n=1 Tax=Pseudomonas sp. H1h TaxID=1397280 RepID=UPI0009DE9ED8
MMVEAPTPSNPPSNWLRVYKMTKIDRHDAVKKISTAILILLDHDERESHLLDWWNIDESNPEFFTLSEQLQRLITSEDDLPSDIDDKKYDELIMLALTSSYKGVTNAFISKKLKQLNIGEYEVSGEIETLMPCPCCKYRTLSVLGNYEICDLCKWEDNGTSNLDTYSGPNHMTLREAKEIFAKKIEKLPLDKWMKD